MWGVKGLGRASIGVYYGSCSLIAALGAVDADGMPPLWRVNRAGADVSEKGVRGRRCSRPRGHSASDSRLIDVAGTWGT